eukprot:4045813-Amphidinium_carterae.1
MDAREPRVSALEEAHPNTCLVNKTSDTVKENAVKRMAEVETQQDLQKEQIQELRDKVSQLQEIIQLMYDDEDEKKSTSSRAHDQPN